MDTFYEVYIASRKQPTWNQTVRSSSLSLFFILKKGVLKLLLTTLITSSGRRNNCSILTDYNPEQNIWLKVRKSNKIGENFWKTMKL